MTRLVTQGALATVALFVLGCGGSSTDPSSDTARCRRYATAFTSAITFSSIPDATASTNCTFDRATVTLRCTQSGSGGGQLCLGMTTQTVYASLTDFVEEAAAVGRRRLLRLDTSLSGGCAGISFSSTYVYDTQKRPLTVTHTDDAVPAVTTFGAWDALGRPTTESHMRGSCQGETSSITYDDGSRRTTTRTTSVGTGRGCGPGFVSTVDYDPDGNIVREVATSAGVIIRSQTYTIGSTENVCS